MANITFRAGGIEVVKATKKAEPRFALIAKFKGSYKVISIHSRRELADPLSVKNSQLTDIQIAEAY